MFTEDYQVEAIKKYFPAFDQYKKLFFIGEMIWNFADFATAQSNYFYALPIILSLSYIFYYFHSWDMVLDQRFYNVLSTLLSPKK